MIGKIKTGIKIVLLIIQISLSLVSAIGILSTTQILSSPDNISVQTDTAEIYIDEFNPSYLRLNITFNNRGAFDISDVSFTARINIIEKPEYSGNTSKSYIIMEKTIGGVILTSGQVTLILVNASGSDFTFPFLEDVWIEIGNQEYDYFLDLEVNGKTNSNLVSFKINVNYNITGKVYA